jgi:hypothetical protein
MAMSESARGDLLSRWIKPSSEDEQVQQDRAQRMVTDAVKRHDTLKTASLHIYAKGSYANNTNVRRDSDVDIVVECQACQYFDYMPGQAPATALGTPYTGEWTPAKLRSEVTMALTNAFGASSVSSASAARPSTSTCAPRSNCAPRAERALAPMHLACPDSARLTGLPGLFRRMVLTGRPHAHSRDGRASLFGEGRLSDAHGPVDLPLLVVPNSPGQGG